jgi:hypothetical protein
MPQPPQDLTQPELQNLRRVSDGGAVSDVMYRRLTALGLIKKSFRGWAITASGKARLAAQDEAEDEDET